MTKSQKIVEGRVIDPNPADNGDYKTQREWIDFFNREGKAMMSPSDIYNAPDSILSSFREDIQKEGLVTSSRLLYNPNNLRTAKIIHNFGSTVVKPTERAMVIPVYDRELIENATKGLGLKYLQSLFETEDDASKLIERLEEISDKEAKDILVWTPDEVSRAGKLKRIVSLDDLGEGFFIIQGLAGPYDDHGPSRGVSIK